MVGYADDHISYPSFEINIERTTDGGKTWQKQESGYPRKNAVNDAFLRTVCAIDSLNIVIVGDSGMVDRTTDGGATWHPQVTNSNSKIQDVSFVDSANGMIVCGQIQLTTDAGNSWRTVDADSAYLTICKMFSKNEQSALQYGYGPFFHTTNQWKTWDTSEPFMDPSLPDPVKVLPNAFFKDPLHFFGLGYHYTSKNVGTTRNSYIIRTDDGGKHWQTILDTADPRILFGLKTMCINKKGLGIASGYGTSGILFTTDDGYSWVSDTIDGGIPPCNITASSFPGEDNVYMIASVSFADGRIIKLHFSKLLKVDAYETLIYGTHIFPNPSDNWLTIYVDPPYETTYSLYDILGRKIMDFIPTGTTTRVNTEHLPPGAYRLISNYEGKRVSIANVAVVHGN
ncbi:MAG TPA: T9SS type A sorting domain-containing protein [Candidatus Kapabacteria bacterium]|nr:T9SS type A sorting domain-containing protein [Candidatus Kapabacteria bacterium]